MLVSFKINCRDDDFNIDPELESELIFQIKIKLICQKHFGEINEQIFVRNGSLFYFDHKMLAIWEVSGVGMVLVGFRYFFTIDSRNCRPVMMKMNV
jgi:hypothetical protein